MDDPEAADVVHRRGVHQQEEKAVIPRAVEEEARREHHQVLTAFLTEPVVQDEHRGEENRVRAAVEIHRQGLAGVTLPWARNGPIVATSQS